MSDQDQVKPYHAKDAAPGQEAADVVAEVLKHAAEREEAAKKRTTPKGPPKWMLPVTVNLGVLALYFLIAQPDFLVVNPPRDPRSTADKVDAERRGLYFAAIMRVEAYRTGTGRLPANLNEAGVGDLVEQGVEYEVIDSTRYRIAKSVGDVMIEFDSGLGLAPEDWIGPMNLGG